jgi:Tfp pilus assembly protein PilF
MYDNISPSKQNLLNVLIIIFFTLICFSSALHGSFIYDDHPLIENHASIKSLSYIPRLFQENAWGVDFPPGNYRPINNVTIALNFAINGLNPYGYHLVNIFIHILNSLLVYYLCNNYTKIRSLSLLCSLFFALHPVHSEAVAAIYSRPEILATLFLFIAWWFYFKSQEKNTAYTISLISYFLSLLSKESGIVLIPILLLTYICAEQTWRINSKTLAKIAGYVAITVIYLIIRISVTKSLGVPKSGQFFANESFSTRLYTMSLGYIKYFQILFWPTKLYTEYDYSVIAKVTSINLSVILSLAILAGIFVIGIWQIKRNPVIAFAILFFYITTSVVSNIIFPTGIFIAERVVYLASLSTCLILAAFFYWLHNIGWKKGAIALSIVALSLTGTRLYYRNLDFKDDVAFFNSILKTSPKNAKALYALGLYYQNNNDPVNAEMYLKKSIELAPNYANTYAMLGNFYLRQNQNDKALELFNKALALSPNIDSAHSGLARLCVKNQDYKKAAEHFLIAINNAPPNAKLEQEFAVVLYNLNDFDQATLRLNKSIALDPTFAEPYVNLAKIKRKQAKEEEAIALLKKALEVDPNSADANNLWGAKLLAQGELCKAKAYLTKAVTLDNNLAEAHNNLGVAYAQMNLYDKAREHFQLAVKLNPEAKNYAQNLDLVNEKGQMSAPAINCP